MTGSTKPETAQPGTRPARRRKPGRAHPSLAARNERIIALHREKTPIAEIARLVDRSPNTVYRVLHQAGIPVRKNLDRHDVDGEAIARAYAEGGSLTSVGRRFGVSRDVVERRVLRHGGKLRTPARPLVIAEVVRLHDAGTSRGQIARRLGREWRTIDRALKDAGVKPRDGSGGAYADGTVTWDACTGQNRVKTPKGWRTFRELVWEKAHGPVPPACVIRRIDTSLPRREIDSLGNLVMMMKRTQTMRMWAAKNVPVPDDPIDRREVLVTILALAALKAGDTACKLGTW